MRRFILGAFAAAAMLACSQEQVLEVNRVNDEITFSVVADNQTKANELFCNNYLPSQFCLYGVHHSSKGSHWYIEGDPLMKATYSNEYYIYNGTRFWPEEGGITFYAYYPHDLEMDCFYSDHPTIDFYVYQNPRIQQDFLYAQKTQSKEDNKTVELNFRHGLSQIVFQAQNRNCTLGVVVNSIQICNVGERNTFTFPDPEPYTGDTDGTVGAHSAHKYQMGVQGTWDPLSGGTADYLIEFKEPVSIDYVETGGYNDHFYPLTTEPWYGEQNLDALLLLPQNTQALHPDVEGSYDNDSYFLIDCTLTNLPDREHTHGKYQYVLHDGPLAVPARFDWEQGKRYVYTFIFGHGDGGYEPGTNNPVLAPVEFLVTVDDFLEEDGDSDGADWGTLIDTEGF